MAGFIGIFVINDKKLLLHMDQIIKRINYINHKIHYYDQMRKIIVNLGSNNGDKNDDSYTKITHI